MPQETNFNVSPYFDDFDPNKQYYKVLFKPGYPVQARELTTIQSILQNQIESIGKGSFKEGQVVVPGQISYENEVFALEVNENFNGLPLSLYFDSLLNKEIVGQESGAIADIVALLSNTESERGNYTLYLRYTGAGGQSFNNKTFRDGEVLLTNEPVLYGESNKFSIQTGQGICNAIFTNASSRGSLVNIENGIYFVRGIFAEVKKQTIFLDQYGTEPSYRVGFDVKESIVTSNDDEDLFDNARNFPNYTAPGADRFKIELELTKKDLTSTDLDNFVELLTVQDGVESYVQFDNTQKEKLAVKNQLARRGFDQTGDYIQKDFTITVKDALNDCITEDGIYFENQQTITGDAPSEDKVIYQIGPGKAYINGYEVETSSSTLIQCSKARDLGEVTGDVVPYSAGTLFLVNNTFGSPAIGFSGSTVQLRDRRLGASQTSQGDVIGVARVYDYVPVTDYKDDTSEFFLRLFDINTYTKLEFSSPLPIKSPTFIEGKKSGSSGHVLTYPNTANLSSISFNSLNINSLTFTPDINNGIATVTTSSPHGYVSGDTVFIDSTNLESIDYNTAEKFWSVVIPDLEVQSIVFDSDSQVSGVITVTTVEPHLFAGGEGIGFQNTGRAFLDEIGQSIPVTVAVSVNSPQEFEFAINVSSITDFSTVNTGIVTNSSTGNPYSYLNSSQFQIAAVSDEFDTLGDVSTGTVVKSDEIAIVNLESGSTLPSDNGESVFIEDSSNGQFNSKFTVQNGNEAADTFELSGITALNYYNGVISSIDGTATAGISTITLYEVSGEFIDAEKLVINGVLSNVISKNITEYSLQDVKSINSGTTQAATTDFRSDLVLRNSSNIASPGSTFRISAQSGGESVITAGLSNNFTGTIKPGNIVAYESPDFGNIVYNEVVRVSSAGTDFTVRSVTSVEDINAGGIPVSDTEVTNIVKLDAGIEENENGFLTQLKENTVESVTLEDNEIIQRREFINQSFSQGTLVITIDPLELDIRFSTFDEDRYVITYSDGTKEPLRFDKFALSNNAKTATFYDLSFPGGSGSADVIATVTNNKPNSKIKKLNRAQVLNVRYSNLKSSGIGVTTLNDGLTYSNVYGTRVQDREISLNVPDVLDVVAIYESFDENDAKLPVIEANLFTGPSNNNQDLLIGETIVGSTSCAAGIIVSKKDTDKIEYVYQNQNQFKVGEVIESKSSNIRFTITGFQKESKNITQNFELDDGQTESFYDYSRIVKKVNTDSPKKRLKIVFRNFVIDSSDTGEFITASSYSQVNFKREIPQFQDVANLSDFIDTRPRVSTYVPSPSNSVGPFEFNARIFDSPGQYSRYILAPEEDISISYKYYLPRTDKIVLNPDGTFECIEGVSSDDPITPDDKSDALTLSVIKHPPFTFDLDDIDIEILDKKGYTMSDIQELEDRIERLEKLTELNYLESSLENLKITDSATGLEKFKVGYFADDFSSDEYHDTEDPSYRVSLDTLEKSLRPSHFTTNLDLELGSEAIEGVADTFDPNVDKSFVTDLGSPGVRKTGDLVTLNYEDVIYLEQTKASKAESVTPFLVKYWQGVVILTPSDIRWPLEARSVNVNRTVRTDLPPRPDINITTTNNVVRNRVVTRNRVITRVGRGRRRWITDWRRRRVRVIRFGQWRRRRRRGFVRFITRRRGRVRTRFVVVRRRGRGVFVRRIIGWRRRRVRRRVTTVLRRTVRRTTSVRRNVAVRSFISDPGNTEVRVDTSSSVREFTERVEFLRPSNITFIASKLKPLTRIYPYFETIKIDNYITPKLLEIEMVSGTGSFIPGETVFSINGTSPTVNRIRFRLCVPGHLNGPSTSPSSSFSLIPFTQNPPPTSYTETSTFLNVDVISLSNNSDPNFFGGVESGMRLQGSESGAQCVVRPPRLITDRSGELRGCFFVPDPTNNANPRWRNGQNTLLLTDVPSLPEEGARNESECAAEAIVQSADDVPIRETTVTTTRNIIVTPPQRTNITTVTNVRNNLATITNTRTRRRRRRRRPRRRNRDPLAQTFFVAEESGIFVTGVDIFFRNKPLNLPVTVQIRTVTNGYPTNVTIPFAERTLTPDKVNLSTDGSVPTRFTFPSPVYLKGLPERNIREAPIGSTQLAEYAIVVLSDDPIYEAFISELGQRDLLDGNIIAAQSTLGSLFKSQNGTTWTPSQLEDLKYNLYRADFVEEGIARFFNPQLGLGNQQVTVLGENQLETLSRKAIIKVNGLSVLKSDFKPGATVVQTPSTSSPVTANLIGVGGDITVGTGVSISNVGVGYTDGIFEDVVLTSKTGDGSGATADITVSGNVITNVNITSGGFSYLPGDILEIPDIGFNVGFGGEVIVESLNSFNSLIVDQLNKDYSTTVLDLSKPLSYINSSGITTFIGSSVLIEGSSTIFYDQLNDGLHMKINALNHANHSGNNFVTISEVIPDDDVPFTRLTSELTQTENNTISVDSTSGFEKFEGVNVVSPGNIGYLYINDEVVGFTTYTATTFGGLTRGVDGTPIQIHAENVEVRKYEFGGISLRRINIDHQLSSVDRDNHPTTLNTFYVKIDPSTNGPSRTGNLYFDETRQVGVSGIVVSNNIQFEALRPRFDVIVPSETNLTTKIRTTSATSVDGNEVSFNDEGFTDISLNDLVVFDSPRLIASPINETQNITGTPGNKSFTMEFSLTTENSLVSPVLDVEKASVILTTNLVNAPSGIRGANDTYADDEFVRSTFADKHEAVYISKSVKLELPGNSLKVMLDASVGPNSDVRVLYQLIRADSPGPINYEPFPGYKNLELVSGIYKVKDLSKNSGSEDTEVKGDGETFKPYEYTVDNLPEFTEFKIKIVLASKDQADPPLVKNLRAVATVKPQV